MHDTPTYLNRVCDTILAHGLAWTLAWMRRRGVPMWERLWWADHPEVRRCARAHATYVQAVR